MLDLILGLVTANWQWVVGVVGAAGAVFAALMLRSGGKDAVKADIAKDAGKRSEAGRVRQSRAKKALKDGKSPEQIVRDNDGAWGQ